MRTLVIIDSQGPSGLPDAYTDLLPMCRISGYEPEAVIGTPCHPHGAMVGYLAGVVQPEYTSLIFLRIFDQRARAIPNGIEWALDTLWELDLHRATVCRSWGYHAGSDRLAHHMGTITYGPWAQRYSEWLEKTNSTDFGAAGNHDRNNKQDDISYPQRLLGERSNIIGSSNRVGIPSKFSSDGKGLQCLFWGENLLLREPVKWTPGSGTSFATPKAAGASCAHGFDHAEWLHFMANNPPDGWHAQPWHPKYGHGNREHLWQRLMLRVPSSLWPPAESTVAASPAWHDFEQVGT